MPDDRSRENRPAMHPPPDDERLADNVFRDSDTSDIPDDETGRKNASVGLIGQIMAGVHRIARQLENVPPSKRFLIMLVGFLGVAMIVVSVGFGIYSLFAPSRPKGDGFILAEAFVGLDVTLNANNRKINDELMLIVDDGASSTQLMNKGVPKENDLALILRDEFHGISWDVDLSTMRRYISRKPWQVGFLEIKSEMQFLALCDAKREKIRETLDRPDVDMQPSYALDQFGMTLDRKDRDNLWGYVHLEEYELARALTGLTLQEIQNRNSPPEPLKPNFKQALDALHSILKTAKVASRQKELNLRFDAAFIRENALDTVQSLVRHPEFGLHDAKRVLDMLNDQLAQWPSDGLALEGERTAAVWIYEQARRGKLLELLAPQDVASLQKLGTLVGVEQSILRHIDADELFYLTRMSDIIFTCREPYYSRIAMLERREDELEVLRGDPDAYPSLAGAVLLRDVRMIMYRLAVDRARTETWYLALATALREPSDRVTTHPMTGQPYRVRVTTDPLSQNKSVITVNWLDSEEPIVVPGYALSE